MNTNRESSADPVYRSSLAEFRWIVAIWLVCFVWVIGYCSLYGYPPPEQPLTTVLGFPSWVFWGVLLPWLLSATTSCWFALVQVQDHPLDDASDQQSGDRESIRG